jgi:acetolactate synthase-1/2/3 large subunit
VDTLFGLPGVQLDYLFNAVHGATSWLRTINARHEQGVAYMALGYAQSSGRPGVYTAVPGPGFLNTGAALSTAYAVHAPVMALIGQIASNAIGVGGGELHELPDQSAIVRGLTRWAGLARTPSEVGDLLTTGFATLAARRAPVAVELPADVLRRSANTPLPIAASAPRPAPVDDDAIEAAAALLAKAVHPIIVVGGGALHAGAEIDALSARLQAPVISHLQGRGILPSTDPRAMGVNEGCRLWPEADVILAVGTRFHGPRKRWGLRPHHRVIRIDHDPAQFRRGATPDVAIAADARAAVAALIARLETIGVTAQPRLDRFSALKREVAAEFSSRLGPQMAYLNAIAATLPPEAIVVADYTQVGYVATNRYPVAAPRRILTPGYQGTLGFAYATALGARVANPDVPVVALCGDGGFLFTAAELATAVQYGIAAIGVVFNDGAYGNVRWMQETLYGGKVVASGLTNPDFVRFAESFGAEARRAEGPDGLAEALRWAIGRTGPTLIEVPVSRMPDPWDLLEPQEPK